MLNISFIDCANDKNVCAFVKSINNPKKPFKSKSPIAFDSCLKNGIIALITLLNAPPIPPIKPDKSISNILEAKDDIASPILNMNSDIDDVAFPN